MPLVARFAPSDTFRIWKRGSQIRMDSNVRGMNGSQVEKGLISFLFDQGNVMLVDHLQCTFSDALAEFRNPSYDMIEQHVQQMMTNGEARSEIEGNNIRFKVSKKAQM